MIGADIVLSALERQGVDTVFGLPGGAVIPLYDRLHQFSSIHHILVKHEQGAIHAADGYARASGKVGVCFATSGPGATNLMTGLINAQMDSVPVVAITGQVAKDLLGKDSFQEAFVTGMTQSVCKYSVMVTKAEDIPQVIANAFFIAQNGRPGPVVVDIPKDVFLQEVDKPNFRCEPTQRYQMKLKNAVITKDTIRKITRLIEQAERPLLIVGGGANTAYENKAALQEISEAWGVPIALTLMGTGLVDKNHPHFLGMVGMHGTARANYAVQHADLLIAIGMRFDDRVTSDVESFAPHAKIVHVDIDTAEIGKNVRVDTPIVGDAKDFLRQLHTMVKTTTMHHDGWLKEVFEHHRRVRNNAQEKLPVPGLLRLIDQHLDEKSIIITDVGQHQMWSALHLHPHGPRKFLTSGGLGTMGFGFPAAIGAYFADPSSSVYLVTGDGSFQMNMQELAVVKEYKIPIKIFLMNNRRLGMVRQWQQLFHNENYAETILECAPKWDLLSSAYDIRYEKITTLAEAEEKIPSILAANEPIFIDLSIDPMANVYPMVPGGMTLDHIVGEFEDEA